MKPTSFLFGLLLLAILTSCAPSADDTNAEMNAVIRAIHTDFLKMKGTNAWFSNYSKSNLYEGEGRLGINYYPYPQLMQKSISTFKNMRQYPDAFMIISCEDLDEKTSAKSWDDFEDLSACRFPSLNKKINGVILIPGGGAELEKIKALVKQTVEMECTKLQQRIPQRKSD